MKRLSKNATHAERLAYQWDVIHEAAGDTKVRQGRRNVWQMTDQQARDILAARHYGTSGVSLREANLAINALMGLDVFEPGEGMIKGYVTET